MNIKTWRERLEPPDHGLGIRAVDFAMQAEIDELRAALLERDAEIALAKDDVHKAADLLVASEEKLAAQRKSLNWASEALAISWPMRGRYISTTEFETDCAKHQDAITAIQEQLK